MYIAMNRFKIAKGREKVFIELWKSRDSYLNEVPGFDKFQLLQGATGEEATLFISHSQWASKQAFDNWRQSDHFKKSHAQARAPEGTYLGHPQFEGFEMVLG